MQPCLRLKDCGAAYVVILMQPNVTEEQDLDRSIIAMIGLVHD